MDLSNATIVADFGSGIGTEGSVLQIDTDNKRLGIGTDNPQAILQVGTGVTVYGNSGIVSATYFYGDASNITNTGSSLDAASGSQRVVVTGQTSGTMTAAATNGNLLFNASTNTLSAENISIGGTLTYEDVTSVDSVGIITARTGLKVTAGGINAVGVVTATSFSGDGSNLSGIESGVENFVASGTIDNGATVIIKDDGTVGIVTQTGDPASVGTAVVWESANSGYIHSDYETTNDKVVIAYLDNANSSYGTAVVGTVSGSSISFGTPVVFNSNGTGVEGCTAESGGKVVISYTDGGNSWYGTSIVGTVSGDTISFGSATVFESSQPADVSSTYDSGNGKIVIAYKDTNNSNYGTAIVGTVSGTSISFGSSAVFNSSTTTYISCCQWGGSGKVLIAYNDASNSQGEAIVGTVSGTSISFGTVAVFNPDPCYYVYCCNDFHTSTRSVIVYADGNNSMYGTAKVATLSGTDITFGSAAVFNTATTTMYNKPVYNSTDYKVVIAYKGNPTGSDEGTAISGTISGTDITFGTAVEFGDSKYDITSVYDPDANKVVISYKDVNNSSYGTSVVYSESTLATNLTTKNYIGIAGEAIANGATGKINVASGTNTGQSGLTTAKTYYVQADGTLATTADSPSVVAGTSISDTKILVR